MRITQWGEFGIHFAVFLADEHRQGKETVGAAQIAEVQGVAVDYAQQILQRLRKGGIVESVRGPLGGYRLSKPATDITLLEVLVASEGESFEVICEAKPLDANRCSEHVSCFLRGIWFGLRYHIDEYFRRFTLASLLDLPDVDRPVQIGGSKTAAESTIPPSSVRPGLS